MEILNITDIRFGLYDDYYTYSDEKGEKYLLNWHDSGWVNLDRSRVSATAEDIDLKICEVGCLGDIFYENESGEEFMVGEKATSLKDFVEDFIKALKSWKQCQSFLLVSREAYESGKLEQYYDFLNENGFNKLLIVSSEYFKYHKCQNFP